jgi:phage minor structural protein
MIIYKRNTPRTDIIDTIDAKAEKMVTLSVQKSNYFNAIQSLCEIAECWADFEVTHNENGEITGKKVYFKRYVGQDNYAGFRYGVNLNSISRQVISTAIVTKLIVPNNVNQHANNGFCSIVRAKSNEIGENYIYDFSYYLNTKMLD